MGFHLCFKACLQNKLIQATALVNIPREGEAKTTTTKKKTSQNSQRAPAVAGSGCVEQDKQREQVPVGMRVHGDDG